MSNSYVETSQIKDLLEKFDPQKERKFYFISGNEIHCKKVSDIKIEMSKDISTFVVFFGYNSSGNQKYFKYVSEIYDTEKEVFSFLKETIQK